RGDVRDRQPRLRRPVLDSRPEDQVDGGLRMSAAGELVVVGPRARRRRLRRRFLRRPVAVMSLGVIIVFVLVALFAPYVAPDRPGAANFGDRFAHPSWTHLFGTDEFGRDVFSRVVWGARASLQVGFLATLLAMMIAVPIGLLGGYYRGWADALIARATDVLLAFPYVILA